MSSMDESMNQEGFLALERGAVNTDTGQLHLMRLGDIIHVASADTYTVKLCDENSGFAGQFVSVSTSDATIIGVVAIACDVLLNPMCGSLKVSGEHCRVVWRVTV